MGSEVKSIFVAAHELKAPLSLMRQLALSIQLEDNPASSCRICQQMINVSERAILQVNDLTKTARLEDGLFAMEPVSVRGVCESVIRDVEPLFGYDRKKLTIRYKNRQKLAVANSELLYSVIYNFCTNAMRYSDADATSLLTVSDEKNYIRINVRDYGPALPTKIWRKFQQGNFTHPTEISMRPGSSGLGLFIVTQFANYMHARLGAIRHHDGTSFYVELPVSTQACLF